MSNAPTKFLKKLLFFSLFVPLLSLVSCYSFTGSSLSPETKTFLIRPFPNNAANNNPNLSQDFTVALQNRFAQRTTLKGAVDKADIIIEGEITDYNITPTTISTPVESSQTGNMIQAAQNKLTITVKVHYENHVPKEESKSFDRTYSDEVTFNSDMDLMTIESTQVKVVNERIINKIFNDIVANW
ncbi:LptE family protein [Soonwooa sp.]|uniref:LptE family protein n=1 Tax=Soonwooa sp. TaxID=1938592 RepID=UPI002635F686|nr:LptE family protein [Soonwooa sp.]